jgi:hypothetical protein
MTEQTSVARTQNSLTKYSWWPIFSLLPSRPRTPGEPTDYRHRRPRLRKDQKVPQRPGNPKVALVIDDVLPPWQPRCVMVRGEAEALDEATMADGGRSGPIIRIHPTQVIS